MHTRTLVARLLPHCPLRGESIGCGVSDAASRREVTEVVYVTG